MSSIGIPEGLVIIMLALLWFIPIASAVWALTTLRRLDRGQHDIRDRLGTIERLLQR